VFILSATGASAAIPQLPLTFEPNRGQAPEAVRYLAQRSGYTVHLMETEAVLYLESASARNVLRARLEGANPAALMRGLEPLRSTSNYLIGNDPRKWHRAIPHFGRVLVRNVYDGIDLTWYGRDGQLEYDFVVAPGADVDAIEIEFDGADRIAIDEQGDLLIHTTGGVVRQRKPVVFQEKREINGRYVATGRNRVGFRVASYDRSKELVIDPVLVYSTYAGGSALEMSGDIAVDTSGRAYIVGSTASSNFPTANSVQTANAGGDDDIFVARLNAAGTALEYSTYLGGNGSDHGLGIAVDAAGNAYISGETGSLNFPIAGAVQPFFAGGGFDGFAAKLNASGSALLFSTFLGGNGQDTASGIAIDAAGNVYLTGGTYSTNFPTMAPFKAFLTGVNDAFVAKLATAGSPLLYSTYHGGNGQDIAYRIAVDNGGNAYVGGFTESTDFPTVGAFQGMRSPAFFPDGFVSKINATGSALAYSTYLGGSGSDQVNALAVDTAGSAYVTGITASADFPTLNPLQPALSGTSDAFVTKLSPSGSSLVFSTYNGGGSDEDARDVAVDAAGNVHVGGWTSSVDFPTVNAVQATSGGSYDGWVTKLSPTGSSRLHSTYLGGNDFDFVTATAADSLGNLHVIGHTMSTNFPTASPIQAASSGDFDLFVAKLGEAAAPPPPPPPPSTKRFNGGGPRNEINELLTYTSPTEVFTWLPSGTTSFDVHIYYGAAIKPSTFKAWLNGVPFRGFKPSPGTDEVVTIPLKRGIYLLGLEVDGPRTDGRHKTDRDLLFLIVK
jgi:hypothetical protein